MSSWWCWLKCWFSIADCQITKGYPNKYLHNFDCEIPEISHSYAWWYIYSSWQPTHVAIVKGLKIQPWELGDIKGYYTHIDIIYYIYNISFKLYIYLYTYIYIFTYLNLSWKFAAKERFTLRRFGDDIWQSELRMVWKGVPIQTVGLVRDIGKKVSLIHQQTPLHTKCDWKWFKVQISRNYPLVN